MRRALYLATAAAIATAALSTPSYAADLRYNGTSMLAEGAKGKPYWMIQAQCSGFFGATSNYYSQLGKTAEADGAKAQGVAFFRDAVDRLVRDRAISRAVAIEAVAQAVDSGRAEGVQKIRDGGGLEPRSHWNVARSVCLDVNDAYQDVRHR